MILESTFFSGRRKNSETSEMRQGGQESKGRIYLNDNILSSGEGNGNPLQYSCLENPMDGQQPVSGELLPWVSFTSWLNGVKMNGQNIHWRRRGLQVVFPDFHPISTSPRREGICPLLLLLFNHSAKSLQSCPTLCDPIDGSPPGSAVPGILQARTLEWVAISFSYAWKWKESEVTQSCLTLLDPMDWSLPGFSIHWIFQARVLEWVPIAFSIQSLSRVQLFATPRTAACQVSLSLIISQSLPKFMFIASVMPSSHLILYHPLLLLPSVFPSINVFSLKGNLQTQNGLKT